MDEEIGWNRLLWIAIWALLIPTLVAVGISATTDPSRSASEVEGIVLDEYPNSRIASSTREIGEGLFRVDVVTDDRLLKCIVDVPSTRADCFER
ncbi:hypothetical protein ACFT2C_06150 [Promicromonospora sp. NPDC057138]|uniref:hypothetical protein n=1 Tax=Promicromonospora sp. NPDC057138 TaxID=3346031 RepID=UPI00364333C4